MDEVKISAVFSLVGDSNNDNASPPNLPDVLADINSSTDTATSTCNSEDEEPPTLTSEMDCNTNDKDVHRRDTAASYINNIPPILQLEEETFKQTIATRPKQQANEMTWLMKDKTSPTVQFQRRIAPSYIVLKSVEMYMGGKPSISHRKFKRIFSDCTNMCKKTYFVRRLMSGKDVFNVKTPRKQKDYYLYLEDQKIGNLRKNKPTGLKSLKSMLNTKRYNIFERNTSNANHMKRVRRTVTFIPKDFHSLSSFMNKQDLGLEDDDFVDEEERLKRQIRLKRMKQHALDALVLRKQIEIKRSHNKTMKKLKSKSKSNLEARNITKDGVTSSVSGRVRIPNRKYLAGYAVDRNEINEQLCVEKTNNRLKKLSNEVNIMKQKRQTEDDHPLMPANKRSKPVICIDNPEKESVTRFTCDLKMSNRKKKKRRPIMKEANTDVRKIGAMSSGNGSKDGVLIQEMPNEGSVIADILQSKPRPSLSSAIVSHDRPTPTELDKSPPKPIEQSVSSVRVSVSNFLQSIKTLSHLNSTIADAAVPVSTNGLSHVSNKTTEMVPGVQRISTSTKFNSPMLVKTQHGLRYVIPHSTTSPLVTKPDVSGISECKAPITPVTPMVVTVKSDGSLQSIVPLPPPTQTSVTTARKGNISLLGGGLLPLHSYGPQTVVPKTLPSSTGPIPTVVPQRMHCLPSKGGNAVTQKWSPSSTLVKPQTTTVQSSPMSFNSPVVMRFPLLPVVTSAVGTSQGLNKVGTSVVSATSLLTPTPVAPNTNVTSQYCFQKAPSTTNIIRIPLNTNVNSQYSLTKAPPSTNITPVTLNTHVTSQYSFTKTPSMTNITHVGLQDTKTVKTNCDTVGAAEKAKFYLLKIDGKNVLIPVDGCQFQPKAYVVNNDVASKLSTSTSPTKVRGTVNSIPVLHKPTLAVEPNVKGDLNPPVIKIKQEPMDDWSEHLMKTTVSASSQMSLLNSSNINSSNIKHIDPPKGNVIAEKQHMQNIRGHLREKLMPNKSSRKELAASSAAVDVSVQRNNVSATSTVIDDNSIHNSSASDGVDSSTSVISNNEDKSETAEEKKPLAFTEALTAREERLRKLKELLKEKQKAVEAIRSIKSENE